MALSILARERKCYRGWEKLRKAAMEAEAAKFRRDRDMRMNPETVTQKEMQEQASNEATKARRIDQEEGTI
jgi:hypothetical protein